MQFKKLRKKRKIIVRTLHQNVATRWGSTRSSMESFLDEKTKEQPNQQDSMEEDEDMLNEDPDLFINNDAIKEALCNIKCKKKTDVYGFLLSRLDMTGIKNIHQLLTKLDIFTTTLRGANMSPSLLFFLLSSPR